ncbi:NADH-quinone oxidoreductase subunit C [Salinimicrobium oceani]|uniref:NADH-quinone oxidoreductase subunit C n=1 Tax=Salinimicrobium oceani TaxID=2722702 RepID=A0ABX1CUK0_9FLAO|nr:NADH-quinone oxidoreductase subunit C [Salinimicrobium oceani]NJW51570.1 NADH-quinone oxidoreductase subunit C [Salinimicrobium oceani]
MTNEAIQQTILSWFPDPEFPQPQFSEEGSQYLTVNVEPGQLHELMQLLKNNPETHFDYLFCLTGVDYGKEFGVVYHLESTVHRHTLVVKVQTNRENPVFDSVQDLWATANYHEREVYDFFGIKFSKHPNLKRLFLTEDWQGFPLRKDYVDETNMVVK